MTQPDAAAFKHYWQTFRSDAANLRNNHGRKKTVAGRMGTAADGLVANLPAADDKTREVFREWLIEFEINYHLPTLEQYTVPLDQTPLNQYWPQIQLLKFQLQAIHA